MSEIVRSPYGRVWSSEGEKIAPADDKLDLGWIQEMMPYQWENWLTERQDRHIAYLLQKGIPEFHLEEQYIAEKSYVAYRGGIYLALLDSVGVAPTSTIYWKRVSTIADNAGVITVAGGGTGANNAAAARTNLGIGSLGVQENTSVDIAGGAINGTSIGASSASTGRFTTIQATVSVTAPSFIGALTGNASTATTLQTGRLIGLDGAVTSTPVQFNGSQDINIPILSLDATKLTGLASVDTTGNAGSATKLATSRTFSITGKVQAGGVLFDGTGNISLNAMEVNADTAETLATARLIGGVSFDGSADINLPGVNAPGNQNTSGNAATATKLAAARPINGVNFDGTSGIDIQWKAQEITSGVNLNTLTAEGIYFTSSSAITDSLVNSPVTGTTFALKVYKTGVGGACVQEMISYVGTNSPRAYRRIFNGSAWSNWGIETMTVGTMNSATQIAAGTIDERPTYASAGLMRLNTTSNVVECFDGYQWAVVGTVSTQGLPTFTHPPITNSGPAILVTLPHIRFMVWNGTKYVRAPWHRPGIVQYMYETTAVLGMLPLRGDVVYEQADYPDLAEYLGLSGEGTFTLVETRGEFIRVLDNGRGIDIDRENRSLQLSQNLEHTHTVTVDSGGSHGHTGSAASAGAHTHTVSGTAASAGAHTHGSGTYWAGESITGRPSLSSTYGSDSAINTTSAGAHTHSVSGTAASAGAHTHTVTINAGGAHTHTGTATLSGGDEARPRNVAFSLWITY